MSIDQEFKAMVKDAVNEELLPLKRALSRLEALVALRVEPLAEEKAATPKKKKKEKKVQLSSFADVKEAAKFFGVNPSTIHKWLEGSALAACGSGFLNAEWDCRKNKYIRITSTSEQRVKLTSHISKTSVITTPRADKYLKTGKVDWNGSLNFVSVAGQTVAKKKEVYKTSFADVKEAAKFFGVNPSTIHK